MKRCHFPLFILAFFFGFEGNVVGGELQLAKVFSDHAVLQRDAPLPIWGRAKPNTKVQVEFSGQKASTISNGEGRWRLEWKPLDAASEGRNLTVSSGEETIEVSDLLVGEVWLASGQSNMQMTLASSAKKLDPVAQIVSDPESRPIRVLRIDEPDSPEPLEDLAGVVQWQIDNPVNRSRQSAVAYFFARELQEQLGVPVGVIETSWGGKPIEGFIPREGFQGHEVLERVLAQADKEDFDSLAKSEGGVIIRNTAGRPGRIFHARIAPVAPFAIAGFLWYQGESNAGKGEDPRFYRQKMEALVDGWRATWGNPELPFYFVQLPSYKDSATGWVRLREEQRLSLEIENTGMAVTIDLRDEDIHPANKVDVGKRLAAVALAKTYQEDIPFCGPLFLTATREGKAMRVTFEHAEGGLWFARKNGLGEPVESRLADEGHFELADEEGTWHPASAKIEGGELVVFSEAVEEPVAVRYACEGDAEGELLYNREGFPASPFCSELRLLPWKQQPAGN
ncbi:MAG: sialate O-acetylesterase [Verrucomicrobiales bacterium]|nr:sialate O-acetylesterase [Verrucomicrobiales bacterium]